MNWHPIQDVSVILNHNENIGIGSSSSTPTNPFLEMRKISSYNSELVYVTPGVNNVIKLLHICYDLHQNLRSFNVNFCWIGIGVHEYKTALCEDKYIMNAPLNIA